MTQEELEEKVGLTSNYLGQIERGWKTPSLKTLVKLANELGVSVDHLLRPEDNAPPERDLLSRQWLSLIHEQPIEDVRLAMSIVKALFRRLNAVAAEKQQPKRTKKVAGK